MVEVSLRAFLSAEVNRIRQLTHFKVELTKMRN
jgi:hypothetical protein